VPASPPQCAYGSSRSASAMQPGSGTLASSGALTTNRCRRIEKNSRELVVAFRAHQAIGIAARHRQRSPWAMHAAGFDHDDVPLMV
jgi:hypothetical protein